MQVSFWYSRPFTLSLPVSTLIFVFFSKLNFNKKQLHSHIFSQINCILVLQSSLEDDCELSELCARALIKSTD